LTFNWRPLNELIIITLRCAAQCIVIGPVCGFSTAGGRCPNLAIASARAVFASLWALFSLLYRIVPRRRLPCAA